MSQNRRKRAKSASLILSFFSFLFSQIGRLARQSVILGFFLNYDALEKNFHESRTGMKIGDFSRMKARTLALKLKCAEYSQNSLFINLFEKAAYRLFCSSLRSFGVFLFSFGGFLVSVNVADGLPRLLHWDFSDTFLFGCILVVISFFLLPVKNKSIAMSLRDSKILSYFLFDIFTVKHIALTEKGKVLPTSGFSLALGLVCGLFSYAVSPWLTAFVIFLILLLYLIFTRPENGILAVCLLLPFAGQKILSFLIVLTLLSTAFKVLRGKRSLHFNLCSGVLGFFCLIALSGVFFSFDAENAADCFCAVFLSLLFALDVISLVNSSSLADKCFRTLSFSALAASLYAVYEFGVRYLAAHNFSGIYAALRQNPLHSSFDNADMFAAFLICLVPVMFFSRKTSGKLFSFLSLAVVIFCLISTNSSYAMLSLIIAVVVSMILFSPYGLGTAAFVALAAYAIHLFVPFMGNRRMTAVIPQPESLLTLLSDSHIDGINEFLRKLWLSGAGIGRESVAGASVLIQAQLTGYRGLGATYVNLILKIGVPLTLAAVFLLFVFFARILSYAYGSNKSEVAKGDCMALVCSLLACMLYAFFADLIGDFRICVLFFLLLALGSAVSDSADNDYIPPYFEREYN